MSYLQDKKQKRKQLLKIVAIVAVVLVLIYARSAIFRGFSFVAGGIFRPVLVLGNGLGEKLGEMGSYFISKKSLYLENESLKSQISESEADRANYASVVADNANLLALLGRKDPKTKTILGAILAKPNQSAYDTIVLDIGSNNGINEGDTVFALGYDSSGQTIGSVPIGKISDVLSNTSKAILFSSPGEKTEGVIPGHNIFVEVVGRGGGNFEMIVPRDVVVTEGGQVVLPGTNSYTLAVIDKILSDPRDPFNKALLESPVNIEELKFVEVEL